MFFGNQKPDQNFKPGGVQRPQQDVPDKINEPTWEDPAFVQWFFQGKPKDVAPFDDGKIIINFMINLTFIIDFHKFHRRCSSIIGSIT